MIGFLCGSNLLLVRDIAVNSEEVFLRSTVELEFGRIASSCDDFVALGKAVLNQFVAKSGGGACYEEHLWCHLR